MTVTHVRRPGTIGVASFGRLVLWLMLLSGTATLPARAQPATDLLGVPGPISFQGTQFDLAWTSHPADGYFKQEYLPAGERLERFNQMFIIEALESSTPDAAAAAQVDMLEKRKGSDPVVNYAVLRNDAAGEIILDFILSDSSTGTDIVEWNAYRYAPLDGHRGVALYAISRRGYGEGTLDFLQELKQSRPPAIDALAAFDAPPLKPSP
jgi:hypothetical protein